MARTTSESRQETIKEEHREQSRWAMRASRQRAARRRRPHSFQEVGNSFRSRLADEIREGGFCWTTEVERRRTEVVAGEGNGNAIHLDSVEGTKLIPLHFCGTISDDLAGDERMAIRSNCSCIVADSLRMLASGDLAAVDDITQFSVHLRGRSPCC